MAQFFKNYKIITLKILNDEISKKSKEEIINLNIQPKYLGMTHIKHCDFCNNQENKYTLTNEITFLFGYQTCINCSEKNIGITFIKKWYVDNNSIPFNYFISNYSKSHTLTENKNVTIQRTCGKFENTWVLDFENPLKYIINENEDILIPIYKTYSENDDNFKYSRGLAKRVLLSELCRFNRLLDESEIINNFKKLFIKYQE